MTLVETVRLLTTDTDPTQHVFTDVEIGTFLGLNGNDPLLAAAQALDVIASNEALVAKRISMLDLSTDGPAVARALREHAVQLRVQAAGADGLFTVAPPPVRH